MSTPHPDPIRSLSLHEQAALKGAARAHAMALRRQAFQDVASALGRGARRVWRMLSARPVRRERCHG